MTARHWTLDQLRLGDRPDEAPPSEIDLTGRGRIVLFGPYQPLDPGTWRLSLSFKLCMDAVRYPFLLQFGEGADLSEQNFRAERPGQQVIEVDHTWLRPAQHAELRLWVIRPVFHGYLSGCTAGLEQVLPR